MKTRCPRCGNHCDYDKANPWRPFCSERCKLIDLGEWVTEKNRIPDAAAPENIESIQQNSLKH